MTHLVFYSLESQKFPNLESRSITQDEAKKIVEKLSRHFVPEWTTDNKTFFHKSDCGMANVHDLQVFLPEDEYMLDFGVVVHEVAHIIQVMKYLDEYPRHKNYRTHHHKKRLMNIIKRLNRYCIRHNYWNMGKMET